MFCQLYRKKRKKRVKYVYSWRLKHQNHVIDVVLVLLLLTLNIFHTFFSVFIVEFEQVNLSWDCTCLEIWMALKNYSNGWKRFQNSTWYQPLNLNTRTLTEVSNLNIYTALGHSSFHPQLRWVASSMKPKK